MGFRQFSLRGLKKVAGEWTLVALAWNLKWMNVLRWDKKEKQHLLLDREHVYIPILATKNFRVT